MQIILIHSQPLSASLLTTVKPGSSSWRTEAVRSDPVQHGFPGPRQIKDRIAFIKQLEHDFCI